MADAAFQSLLNKTATLYRPTYNVTPNSLGEREVTSGSAVTTFPCSLQPLKEKFELDYGGYKYWVELALYTEYLLIVEKDLIEVGGVRYLAVGVEDEGGQGHHLKVLVVRQ